jgi:hypothetical protein
MAVREQESDRTDVLGNGYEPPTPSEQTFGQRALYFLSRSWLFVFLLLLVGYFWLTTPSGTFLTWSNLSQIALTTSEVVLLAIGETFVIVSAGIDLSIGGILFFAGVAGGSGCRGRASRRSTASTRTRGSASASGSSSASSPGSSGAS